MSQACIILLVLFKFVSVYGYISENVMYYPVSDMRSVERRPFIPEFQEVEFSQRHTPKIERQQQILHTNQLPAKQRETHKEQQPEKPKEEEVTFKSFLEALSEVKDSYQKEQDTSQDRTAAHVQRENPESSYRPYPGATGYTRPNTPTYGPAPTYQNSSPIAIPDIPKLPLLKPDLSTLLKPVSTKVSSKVSGLLGLILALFSGSSADGLEMNGLKDLVINGIVKPLLIAKGGIKSLISKLTIPLIALLLINIEVLITVWWLWEDCDIKKTPIPTYSYPKPAYNYNKYNNYNSYR